MCGKTAVVNLKWREVYAWASSLTPPAALPADPESHINVSPSRLRRKSEPDSMVWETLPVVHREGGADAPSEAIWPFIPFWANGQLPTNKAGKLISTANARLRHEGQPFAPTFMGAWNAGQRVLVVVSWFYEFDGRVQPKVPYAVFPLNQPFWVMAGLASPVRQPDGSSRLSVAIITVDPNQVLQSIGHARSPALLRDRDECARWLHAGKEEALNLLRPHPDESMWVEPVPMGIKIPGNENVELPGRLPRPT